MYPNPTPENKKNLLLTFCFACCAGAGQMYMGYTKRGASLMLAFTAIFGVSGFLNLWIFAIFLPVLWFFAFFDTFTLRNATPEYLAAHPDAFVIDLPDDAKRVTAAELAKKYHIAIGAALILCGAYALYSTILMPLIGSLLNTLPYDLNWLWSFLYKVPSLCVAVLIIMVGIRLVRGEKAADAQDEVIEYKGESN